MKNITSSFPFSLLETTITWVWDRGVVLVTGLQPTTKETEPSEQGTGPGSCRPEGVCYQCSRAYSSSCVLASSALLFQAASLLRQRRMFSIPVQFFTFLIIFEPQ